MSDNPHFTQNGLKSYKYNLETKRLGLYIEISHKGHDKYVYNKESTHIYYVLEGKGRFCINKDILLYYYYAEYKRKDVISR